MKKRPRDRSGTFEDPPVKLQCPEERQTVRNIDAKIAQLKECGCHGLWLSKVRELGSIKKYIQWKIQLAIQFVRGQNPTDQLWVSVMSSSAWAVHWSEDPQKIGLLVQRSLDLGRDGDPIRDVDLMVRGAKNYHWEGYINENGEVVDVATYTSWCTEVDVWDPWHEKEANSMWKNYRNLAYQSSEVVGDICTVSLKAVCLLKSQMGRATEAGRKKDRDDLALIKLYS